MERKKTVDGRSKRQVDIFICHTQTDKDIAETLVKLLLSATRVVPDQLRCTSIPRYGLPGGAVIDEQLRADVLGAKVFIALITPDSLQSTYVSFELGTRWGANLQLIPLLACGTKTSELHPPLSGLNPYSCENADQLRKLAAEIGNQLFLARGKSSACDDNLKNLMELSLQRSKLNYKKSSQRLLSGNNMQGIFSEMLESLDPKLRDVIGSHIEDLAWRFQQLIKDSTFEISNQQEFRAFYHKTLEVFKGANFCATSIPSRSYFWSDESTEKAIRAFIKGTGTMSRIFFLSSPEELQTDEVRQILTKQRALGVQVFTVHIELVPVPLRRLVMVDAKATIAWEVIGQIDRSNMINRVVLTSKKESTEEYLNILRRLSELPCIKEFCEDSIDLNKIWGDSALPYDPASFQNFEEQAWQASACAYNEYFGPLTRQTLGFLLDCAQIGKDKDVLDVATGPGYAAAAVQRSGANVTGIDFCPEMIKIAKGKNDPGISFNIANAAALPFPEGSFDAVVINFGIQHFAQPEQAFAEAWRVLRKGGSLAFTLWAKEAKGLDMIGRAIQVHAKQDVPFPAGPEFFKFSEPRATQEVLNKAKFSGVAWQPLKLIWMTSFEQMFNAFYEGTARIRAILHAQSPDVLDAIKNTLLRNCSQYEVAGKLQIPMDAMAFIAEKRS